MARTAVTIQELNEAYGQEKTAEQASASEMSVLNDGRVAVKVENGGGTTLTVTVKSVSCTHGRVVCDEDVTITAGKVYWIGRWTPKLFNQPLDAGLVYLNFDKTASITVHGVKI